jgi:hypothetical protein
MTTQNKLYIFSFLTVVFLNSCSKTIQEDNLTYPTLNPTRLDTNASDWKFILLTNAGDINCPAPMDINSNLYSIEIKKIKDIQSNLSSSDQNLINYWGSGSILRWNEIMRELVAKNNLPPYQNPDGSYPIPNSNNPFAYPTFPFATPPYAARAYAYLSASQYDALIVAYHYKKIYRKKFPFETDTQVRSTFKNNYISSFPSEDAVIAGVSLEIMKLLFPADIEKINAKVLEHKKARMSGGSCTESDWEASMQLGKDVATRFVSRAKTDGAGTAGGNASLWKSLEQTAVSRGETPWISQESPTRPPMLPLFGKVQPFLFPTSAIAANLRPSPPPSVYSDQFKKELEEILQFSDNLTREQERIANFWADGIRTYTPPGHWNYIASNDYVKMNLSEPRWSRNLALLNMALMDAAIVAWDTKYYYFNPRPMQMDTRIKTCLGLPNFPAFISGHSTFSGAAAQILGYLNPAKKEDYNAMAKEASDSRLYGCIHYRSDCEVGLVVGKKIGNYAIERAKTDGAE